MNTVVRMRSALNSPMTVSLRALMLLCPSSSALGLLSCLADVARGGSEFAGRQRLEVRSDLLPAPTRPGTGPTHVWCTSWRTTVQKPGHPNHGVSRQQASGRHEPPDILTVERVADSYDRAEDPRLPKLGGERQQRVLGGLNWSSEHPARSHEERSPDAPT